MGICQCQTNHIITTHYVEGSRSKLIVHTENISTTQNTNYLCTNKYISSESSNYPSLEGGSDMMSKPTMNSLPFYEEQNQS